MRHPLHSIPRLWLAMSFASTAGCNPEQSAFAGFGPVSSSIAHLAWIMFYAAVAITVLICLLFTVATHGPEGWRRKLAGEGSILWGGIVFPVAVLSVLLYYGFSLLQANDARVSAENPVRISVVGEQWWWRVVYRHADGRTTESANEIRIPAGRPVEIELTSADVIHSFWLPAYAGKVDMIPGHTNRLHFVADAPGVVRGQCAEYCGGAHALMAFYAVAMAVRDYDGWLRREKADARPAAEKAGERLFSASGCGGCHTVRGTAAGGKAGPDLTHVGSRLSLGAGILPNTPENLRRWIGRHQRIKPGNLMLPFDFLTDGELRDLSAYLKGLE